MSESVVARVRARGDAASRLDAAVLDKLRIVLGDALGLARESAATPTARTVAALAAAAPDGPASVIGMPRRVDVDTAVLANSALVHALLRDDAHAGTMLHPAAVVIPVALAVAEERGSDGAALLRAIATGYEVLVAVAEPVAELTAGSGLRNTALFGPIGAAAAAASLAGLDAARFEAALLIASGNAGGTLQAFRAGSPEWRFQAGLAGCAGIAAARLAAAIDEDLLPFPAAALESPTGLYATVAGATVVAGRIPVEPSALAQVSHKKHATCGANQVPVAALAALRRRGVDVEEMAAIEVELSHASFAYPGCEDYGPFEEGATFLSRPFALAATALGDGGPLDATRVAAALADPRLLDVARRVTSRVVPDADLASPQDARLTVVLASGERVVITGADLDPTDLDPDWSSVAERLDDVLPGARALIAGLPATDPAQLLHLLRSTDREIEES